MDWHWVSMGKEHMAGSAWMKEMENINKYFGTMDER